MSMEQQVINCACGARAFVYPYENGDRDEWPHSWAISCERQHTDCNKFLSGTDKQMLVECWNLYQIKAASL